MKVCLHGTLRRYGDSFDLEVETVADAITALSSQLPDWPRDMLLDVPGYDTLEKINARTDAEEIHVIPAVFGGGGKFGSIILGAALIGLSFIPGAGPAGTLLLGKYASAAMVAGATMVLNGVVGLFMKAPSISRENDPEASKYLGLNKNTTAIGTPITLAWGRIPPKGHYLSLQSNADTLVHAVWPTNPT